MTLEGLDVARVVQKKMLNTSSLNMKLSHIRR